MSASYRGPLNWFNGETPLDGTLLPTPSLPHQPHAGGRSGAGGHTRRPPILQPTPLSPLPLRAAFLPRHGRAKELRWLDDSSADESDGQSPPPKPLRSFKDAVLGTGKETLMGAAAPAMPPPVAQEVARRRPNHRPRSRARRLALHHAEQPP